MLHQLMVAANATKTEGPLPKNTSTDLFLESLFGRRKDTEAEAKGGHTGERRIVDSDEQTDLEFRKDDDEGESEEMLMDWQQDSTDAEFEDHWGVERRGATTDGENDDGNDSDEDGGEMMPVFF